MERTIDKAVKSAVSERQATALIRNVLPNPGGFEIIWVSPQNCGVVGSAVVRSLSPQALLAITDDLRKFAAEELERAKIAAIRAAAPQPPPVRTP